MARHTIGDRRGSVRGAPPDVYLPFGSYHESEDELAAAFRPVIRFFLSIIKGLVGYVILLFILVVWYAFCTDLD